MLVTRRFLERVSRDRDESGAVLVTVVVVMLVGFVIAVTIASSVMFTMENNAVNKDRTQAFIAAESGRDKALANVMAAACTTNTPNAAVAPFYRDVVTTTGPNAGSLTAACPSLTAPSLIRIDSTGVGPDGSSVNLTSTFQRAVTYVGQPGGVMAYFSGQFKATQSLYVGDLVIRDGNYLCNAATVIDGDLWVPRGGVVLSADCEIRGNIYAEKDVVITSAKGLVTGSISARGNVTIDSSQAKVMVDVRSSKTISMQAGDVLGSLFAGEDVNITGGLVAGSANARLDVDVDSGNKESLVGNAYAGGTATEKKAVNVTGTLNSGNAGPVADPAVKQDDLNAVFLMTTWVDVPLEPAFWGSDVQWTTGPCDGSDVTSTVIAPLSSPYTRSGIDYRGCTGPVTINVVGGVDNFTHDAIFLVSPGSVMNITTGNINSTGTKPQLFFVQGDNILGNSVPNCGAGMASGDLTLGSSVNANLMFYTPCGFKKTNHITFDGQFYSNTDGSVHWVQPEFTCRAMEWLPMLDLGCQIDTSVTGETTSTPILGPPTLVSQTEH